MPVVSKLAMSVWIIDTLYTPYNYPLILDYLFCYEEGDCYYFIVKSQFVFVGALCSHSPGGILMVQPSNLPYVVQEFMNHSSLEPEKNVPSWAEWSRLVVCRTDNCHLKDALICWSDWIYNVITMPEFFLSYWFRMWLRKFRILQWDVVIFGILL